MYFFFVSSFSPNGIFRTTERQNSRFSVERIFSFSNFLPFTAYRELLTYYFGNAYLSRSANHDDEQFRTSENSLSSRSSWKKKKRIYCYVLLNSWNNIDHLSSISLCRTRWFFFFPRTIIGFSFKINSKIYEYSDFNLTAAIITVTTTTTHRARLLKNIFIVSLT